MNDNQCNLCLYLSYDEEMDEDYCSLELDQDDLEKLRLSKYNSCPYFRMGDEYTIVKRQAVK